MNRCIHTYVYLSADEIFRAPPADVDLWDIIWFSLFFKNEFDPEEEVGEEGNLSTLEQVSLCNLESSGRHTYLEARNRTGLPIHFSHPKEPKDSKVMKLNKGMMSYFISFCYSTRYFKVD